MQIGVNVDSNSSYIADQERYDIEGPKNLFDSQMLVDWLFKMASDHPLLTYVEDPMAHGDIGGYKKCIEKFKELERVQIGVKNWFDSDL